MTGNIQKLSIRLLKEGLSPHDGLRTGTLTDWAQLPGSKILLGSTSGGAPKWSKFLKLSTAETDPLHNSAAFGVLFVPTSDRWFAVTFGMGHVRLEPASYEQDFGLRVVVNTVDPHKLRSADLRTPDDNTLSRRSQTSRGADQTAFAIDVARDIIRGLTGTPKDPNFATRVAGSDGLVLDRKLQVHDLPIVCAEVYAAYQKDDYKGSFAWIDQIKHIRDETEIAALEADLVAALNKALSSGESENLHLAYPVIYDPEKAWGIRYKGFRSTLSYPDLDLSGYLGSLHARGVQTISVADLKGHTIHEVDDLGHDVGGKWTLRDCLSYETELGGDRFVLSGGRWYKVDASLAADVEAFFASLPRYALPTAQTGENEDKYNARLTLTEQNMLCLDRKLVKAKGATSSFEACDFLTDDSRLVHIKDKTSSSRLSHLFSQGVVSARTLVMDRTAREGLVQRVVTQEQKTGRSGFQALLAGFPDQFTPSQFTVIYGVIASSGSPRLPFFSLVTLRQAAMEVQALGFACEFAWISKPASAGAKPAKAANDDHPKPGKAAA
jgi:uncharacterized protein (TIGR04141 family)